MAEVWGTVASIATIAAAGGSLASIGYSAAQGAPSGPNPAASSRAIAKAQAAALPTSRALAAAEQQGGKISVPSATAPFVRVKKSSLKGVLGDPVGAASDPLRTIGNLIDDPLGGIFGKDDEYTNILYKPEEWQEGGKYAKVFGKTKNAPGSEAWLKAHVVQGKAPKGYKAEKDFTGFGTADIEGKLAEQMTNIQSELGAKYGKDFAKLGTAEARQADPLGSQARDLEEQMLKDRNLPINPLAGQLEDQARSQLKAGSGLDEMSQELLDAAVARANADRAGHVGSGDVAREMSTGAEGAARRQSGVTKAQQLLTSGSTPEAIARRQRQQEIADEASFASGQTPESQFQNLSGAGQGATPFYPGQPLPSQPNNAGAAGGPFSVAAWQANLRNQGTQANSWLSGISTALGGLSAVAKATG